MYGSGYNVERPQPRHRIGTPAPQKKNPIPDDFDLNRCDGRRGNPVIRVEQCGVDDQRRGSHRWLPPSNLSSPLSRKPQLDPIPSMMKSRDMNGNSGTEHPSRDIPETVLLPNRYAPLKPIQKKSDDDGEQLSE